MASVFGEHPKHTHSVMGRNGVLRTYSHWTVDVHTDADTGEAHGDKALYQAYKAGRLVEATPRSTSAKPVLSIEAAIIAADVAEAALEASERVTAALEAQRAIDFQAAVDARIAELMAQGKFQTVVTSNGRK